MTTTDYLNDFKKFKTIEEFDAWWDLNKREATSDIQYGKRTKAYSFEAKNIYWTLRMAALNAVDSNLFNEAINQYKFVSADRCEINIISKATGEVIHLHLFGEDGSYQIAIVDKSQCSKRMDYESWSYIPLVLKGEYKVMSNDCSTSYEDEGWELNGYISIYKQSGLTLFVVTPLE